MIEIVTLVFSGAAALLALLCLLLRPRGEKTARALRQQTQDLQEALRDLRTELAEAQRAAAQWQAEVQQRAAEAQNQRMRETVEQIAAREAMLQKSVTDQLRLLEQRLNTGSLESEQKLENIRAAVETRLAALQADNGRRLEEMRRTVDEKLQKTLDETLRRSFGRVSEQLESVYRGLGEMQTLAAGVGDLKKVLGNVKTRGILGEVQLGAILAEILAPAQYAENVATVPGSRERVEFAVKLPGDGTSPVWLPIDAKFPADAYRALLDAYDAADAARTEAAAKALEQRVRQFARDIHEKYIHVPETTEFGIMFLPAEGLYAEIVRRGLIERLQAEWRVIVAGPTTMAALLNSLQMGFRTLAIQKRSGEVWQVLGAVRTEFEKFGDVLAKAQERITQAGAELETLVGTRTRSIRSRLQSVTELPGEDQTGEFFSKNEG